MPGASRSAIVGWLGNELKIRIAAPPEKGKANSAVLKLLAARLNTDKRDFEISSGHTSAHKIIKITGLTQADIDSTFGVP